MHLNIGQHSNNPNPWITGCQKKFMTSDLKLKNRLKWRTQFLEWIIKDQMQYTISKDGSIYGRGRKPSFMSAWSLLEKKCCHSPLLFLPRKTYGRLIWSILEKYKPQRIHATSTIIFFRLYWQVSQPHLFQQQKNWFGYGFSNPVFI